MDRRAKSAERQHHDFVREAILKAFLISRRVPEMSFRDLWLQLDVNGCPILSDSLKDYLRDMRDRGWLDYSVRRTERDLAEIVTVRMLPKGRDVFDGVIFEPGIPERGADG